MRQKVIGLTGPIASGKDVIVEALKAKGFVYYSLSDRVREEARARGLEIERETLQNVGDSLRIEFGNQILAERTAQLIRGKPEEKIVIDSIRNPSEIEYLKEEFDACIIGITAPAEKRFEFLLLRGRTSDPKTKEEFDRLEQRDRGFGQDAHGQQVETCLQMADVLIENNGTLDELKEKIEKVLHIPTWKV